MSAKRRTLFWLELRIAGLSQCSGETATADESEPQPRMGRIYVSPGQRPGEMSDFAIRSPNGAALKIPRHAGVVALGPPRWGLDSAGNEPTQGVALD